MPSDKNKKLEAGLSIDYDALRKKISGESMFISKIMNTVPSISWEDDADDDEEEGNASAIDEDSEVPAREQVSSPILKNQFLLDEQSSSKGKSESGSKEKNQVIKKTGLQRYRKVEEDQKPLKHLRPPEQLKAAFSSEGKMVFSKFDFSEMGTYVERKKKKKECSDPRKILEKLKHRHELLQKLKSEGNEEKALQLKEKDGWNKAFSKVQGLKVRDDPELLKETIYKQDLRKNKHKSAWQNRDEKVQKSIEYKVIKRETNIKAKRDMKLKFRLKKALKKGRVIPGFS